jgi:D-amino-acid dehydrogenase
MQRDDVIVVGAGVVGLACGLALAGAGRGVRVIDAGGVGSGSSHGNCGTVTPSHAPPLAAPGMVATALRMMVRPDAPLYIRPRVDPALWRWLWRFAARCNAGDHAASARAKAALLHDSRARIDDWVRDYALDCEFNPAGEDYVFRDRARFDHELDELPLLAELGIRAEVVDGPAYESLEPAMLPGVAGAIRFEGDAALRPDRYVAELARALRDHGGRVEESRAAVALGVDRDGVRVETGAGVLHAGEVVLAAGAWTPRLVAPLGAAWMARVMQPGKGYSITYARPACVPSRPLVLRERSVCVTAWGDGYRLGSTMEFSGYDTRLNARRLAALERGASEYLRTPVGPEVRERWYGWRPMSCDDVPILGRLPGHRRVWLATGHGMMGVGMSAGTGQLVADLMTGAVPAIDPAPYSPLRFV